MMRYVILCFAFLTLNSFQEPLQVFRLISSIDIEAKDIETDRLGNLYVVSKTNQLYKYSSDGKLLSTLNYKYVGNISYVDATNPLEIYIFYRELNKIIYLDNNLAYRGESDLSRMGIGQASAIARAFDNGIWVFDIADMQLKKLNKKGETEQLSGNVRQFVNTKLQPAFIHDNTERVFLSDSSTGILVFDVFASYIKTIPIKSASHIKPIENNIYFYNSSTLNIYNQVNFKTSSFSVPDSSTVKDISIEKSRLYIMRSDRIDVYAY
jgi:hypothetical protein